MKPSTVKKSPVGKHLALPLKSAKKGNIHQNVVQEETDTDFKDSALGETNEITDATVRELEMANVQMKKKGETIIDQMEKLMQGAIDLK